MQWKLSSHEYMLSQFALRGISQHILLLDRMPQAKHLCTFAWSWCFQGQLPLTLHATSLVSSPYSWPTCRTAPIGLRCKNHTDRWLKSQYHQKRIGSRPPTWPWIQQKWCHKAQVTSAEASAPISKLANHWSTWAGKFLDLAVQEPVFATTKNGSGNQNKPQTTCIMLQGGHNAFVLRHSCLPNCPTKNTFWSHSESTVGPQKIHVDLQLWSGV